MSNGLKERYAQIVPSIPVEGAFEYKIPSSLIGGAEPGKRALVPFGNQKITGYIINIYDQPQLDLSRLKSVLEIIDQEPLFFPEQIPFFKFCADYYQCPLGEVLKTALPPGINVSARKIVKITELGKDASLSASKKAKKLLWLIGQLEELPKDKIPDLIEEPVSDSLLNQLARKGLIEIIDTVEPPKTKPRTELGIKLKRLPTKEEQLYLATRAKEQARLINFLKEVETVLISELREQFKNPLGLAKSLEKRGLVEIEKVVYERKPFSLELIPISEPAALTSEQKKALAEIQKRILENGHQVFLLQGVTGSGKTEVYIQGAKLVLNRGRTVLILVPEIALTPQLLHRFRSRFPDQKIAVLHSGLSSGERFDQWWQIRRGEVSMVIGARSAIFAPLKNLGLIVVDEEQDGAYKQESGVRYQARDLAVYRANKENAVVVLGSATPSLESAYNAELGRYQLLELSERIDSRPLPEVQILDLRKELEKLNSEPIATQAPDSELNPESSLPLESIISEPLALALKENFRRGNQTIIFLNRRGYSPNLLCLDCGNRFVCPNCSVALTFHQKPTAQKGSSFYGEAPKKPYLLCHHCGYHSPAPEFCPQCLSARVRDFGIGTEQVEEGIKKLVPQAKISRMDRDTMAGRKAYFELIQKMESREIDLLIGTQMVAKGHDLPGVTLVAALLADQSLNLPDFRSGERTFQLLTQVAGRSGRGDLPGKVIIQSFNPEHYSIQSALRHNFKGFYEQEMALRKAFGYPPYTRCALFRISGLKKESVAGSAQLLGRIARRIKRQKIFVPIRILGPAPAPIFKLRNRVRFQVLVFAPEPALLGKFLRQIKNKFEAECGQSVRLEIDRDPVSLL